MNMLYTISTSPYYSDFNALINLLTKEDKILLLQDGVLFGHKKMLTDNNYLVQLRTKGIHVFALQNDIEARGLMKNMSSYVRQISYVDFVDLTIKCSQYFAW